MQDNAGYERTKSLNSEIYRMRKGKIGSGKSQPVCCIPVAVFAARSALKSAWNHNPNQQSDQD